MDSKVLITCLLSSAVISALVTSLKDLLIWMFNRKDKKVSESEEAIQHRIEVSADMKAQKEKLDYLVNRFDSYLEEDKTLTDSIIRSNKLLMQDRIRHLGLKYIHEGEILFEDRKMLHDMWDEYHKAWHGNGDLNLIMGAVDELPLK